jgi:hypothetical protein
MSGYELAEMRIPAVGMFRCWVSPLPCISVWLSHGSVSQIF